MTDRDVRLLHVEDEPIQQVLVRQILSRVPGYRFAVVTATGEEEAVTAFADGFDAVVLDYHLTNGNGLSCLQRLRQASPHVPIVALSGEESPGVAAELLIAGADDFFAKDGLDPGRFGAAIGQALARAAAWNRARTPALPDELTQFAREFMDAVGGDFLRKLEAAEKAARDAGMTPLQMEKAVAGLAANADEAAALRPLLLELAVRLLD